jgi:azurin
MKKKYMMKKRDMLLSPSLVIGTLLGTSLGIFNQAAFAAPSATLNVQTAGSQLQFDPKELTVHAGQAVNLTFTNGASPDSGLEHVWVLVMPDKADEVSAGAASAGKNQDYVSNSKDVIAHTHLVKPGSHETIHFTAPQAPGNYPYLCTYPAHYPSMKGTLKVVP